MVGLSEASRIADRLERAGLDSPEFKAIIDGATVEELVYAQGVLMERHNAVEASRKRLEAYAVELLCITASVQDAAERRLRRKAGLADADGQG